MPALQSHNQIRDALARYPLIERVFKLSAERGVPIYLVGGIVRDLALGRDTHDLDFAVQGSGLLLARHVADQLGGSFVPLDRERRTGRVLLAQPSLPDDLSDTACPGCQPQHLDIASLRGEDLHADLEGRDFTINAMAIERTDTSWRIVDPLDGYRDLERRLLRVASPVSFECDPVRTLRAVRMQRQFGCTIEPETDDRLRAAVPLLKHVSAERVRDEWFKILQLADAAAALKEMDRLDLLHEVVPPFADAKGLCHALATVRATERLWSALSAPADQQRVGERLVVGRLYDLAPHLRRRYRARICDERTYLALLKCAALLHGTEVSGAALAARWKLSKREADLLHQAIHHHRDVEALAEHARLSRRTVYHFFAETGEPGIDAATLFLAHTLAEGAPDRDNKRWKHRAESAARLLDAWFEHRDTQVAPAPLLSGRDIMRALDRQAGPQIGELLRSLIEEQAAGEIVNRQQALAYIQRWKTTSQAEG